MRRGDAGFTVIEVVIVMAIAGALLVGAFWAMSSSIESTRFNDTMTSTQSFIQKQFLSVLTGQSARDNTLKCSAGTVTTNPDPTNIPGGSNCILLGRMLKLEQGTGEITSQYIVGTEPAGNPVYITETDAVRAYSPVVVDALADTEGKTITQFDVPWGAKMASVTTGGSEVRYFAIMRSPISERILIYANLTGDMTDTQINESQLNKAVDVCIDSQNGLMSRTGHLMLGAGQGQDLFSIERVGRNACV